MTLPCNKRNYILHWHLCSTYPLQKRSLCSVRVVLWRVRMSHRVSCAVRRGAFATRDAESQPLVVSDEAGWEPLLRPAWSRLQIEGEAAAPSFPGEVVVLWPQWRGGDGVLWLHHTLPQHRHGNCSTRATKSFDCCVMFCFVEVHSIHLRQADWLTCNILWLNTLL